MVIDLTCSTPKRYYIEVKNDDVRLTFIATTKLNNIMNGVFGVCSVDDCKDAIHTCPNCRYVIGKYRKI